MYALLGEKLSHSYSKLIHNLFGTEYELKPVPPDGLKDFVKDGSVQGFNVTIPYKQAIIPYLDGLDEVAESIGAVNTVAKVNGRLIGYNTDCLGLEYTLRRSGISLCGAKVLILGSGGTSKTAAYVARKAKADEIIVVSRRGENNYSNLGKHSDADVILNTTPVGMYPNCEAAPLSPDVFENLTAVADVIYNPLRSRLILAAKDMGLKTATGLPMLVAQARYAEEIWGMTVADEETERVLQKVRRDTENIVLIGMPGCGKSSVGRELARLTGKRFVDTDEEIEIAEGVPVPELVGRSLTDFRAIESRIVKKIASERGQIIATGGGVPLMRENSEALRSNGTVVWLRRNIGELATNGRPLSKDRETLEKMYLERKGIYERTADFAVDVVGCAKTAEKITEVLDEISDN